MGGKSVALGLGIPENLILCNQQNNDMTPQQKAIKEWMRKGGQATPDKPTSADAATRILRVKLVFEEAFELAEALGVTVSDSLGQLDPFHTLEFRIGGEADITKAADATADLRVVVIGTDVAMGIDGEPIDAEVQRSNDSKYLWTHGALLDAAAKGWNVKHLTELGTAAGKTEGGEDVYEACVTDQSGKIMKPSTYSKADIERLILEQKGNA